MPELPDVEAYLAALRPRILGARLERVRLASPFVLRSVEPPLSAASGHAVTGLHRLGKRLVIALEGELYLIVHLMIAGRLHWRSAGARPPGKVGLAAFDFSTGTLVLTEAGTKRRASLHLVRGEDALREHDPGGVDVLAADLAAFRAALQAESHTLKRVLTDPRVFSGNWWTFANGQSMGGPYKPAIRTSDNAGGVRIDFTSSTTATMTLPDGRRIALERQRF